MLILGIDTGSRNLGFAIYDSIQDSIVYYEEWNPTNYNTLFQEYSSFLTDKNVECIVFEKPFYTGATIAKSYTVLETMGILKLVAEGLEIPWNELSPSTVKKTFTGSGVANKDAIKAAVRDKFNININSTHVNDAIAICFSWYIKNEQCINVH